eukprot:2696990-Pyramimonas_sp.AAC.1
MSDSCSARFWHIRRSKTFSVSCSMQAFLQHGMIRGIPRVCLEVYRIVHGYVCGVIRRLPRLEDFVHTYFATITPGFSISDAFGVIHAPVTRVASRFPAARLSRLIL